MRVVIGILLCILLSAIDQTVVLPAIPQMAATLHGGHLSWVVAAYLLTATATTPIYGKLSDQLGRRRVLVPAILLFIAASVLCALASSVPMLIAARALQGLGGGALLAVPQAAVADVIPPRERGNYQAWFAGTWAFSSVAGPIAGGLVTQDLSWRWIFWANIPFGLLALVLSVRGLAGLTPPGLRGASLRGRVDFAGAVLLMLSVAAVLLALSSGGVDFAWVSPVMAGIAAAAVAGFALLYWQQRRTPAPLLPGHLLAEPAFRAIIAISFLNSAGMFGGIFLLPLLLQWVFHASAALAGLEIVPFLFTTTVGAFVGGQLTRHIGRTQPIMAAGLAIGATGFVPMALWSTSFGVVLPLAISGLFGLGIGAVMPTSLVAAQNQSGGRDVGAATGTLLLLRAMGGAFGATFAGAFLALSHADLAAGFRLGFFACAAVLALAAIIALRMEDVPLRGTIDVAPAAAD